MNRPATVLDDFTIALETHRQGRLADAEALYRKIVARDPGHKNAIINLGALLFDMGHHAEAIGQARQALAIDPDHAGAHFNLALNLLALGRFAEGWTEYEWRWQADGLIEPTLAPRWTGQPLNGARIFLYPDQGLGDCIQCLRYVPMVAARGGRVILGTPPELEPLCRRIPGVELVVRNGEAGPAAKWQCALMSLPRAFGTTLESIPSQLRYLFADGERRATFEKLLGPKTKHRIGMVWSGNPSHKNDHNRSIAFERLSPILTEDAHWISLQNAIQPSDAAVFEGAGKVSFYGEALKDLGDTAALIDLMDLVITVDTSVAHLAGAMGKPVWILLPFNSDWRWLRNRRDSPWYPSARLFRQRLYGDWTGVFEEVGGELRSLMRDDKILSREPGAGSAEAYNRRGGTFFAAGRFEDALASCNEAIALEPDYAEAYCNRGFVLHRLNRPEDALASYDRAIALKEDYTGAKRQRADLLRELKRPLDALADLDQVLAQNAADAQAHISRAAALCELRRFEEALVSIDRALALSPDNAEAHCRRGIMLYDLKRMNDAISSYDRAITLKPDYAEAFRNRGVALRELERHEEALASFDRAIELRPDFAEAHNGRGIVLLALKRPDDALASCDQALALRSDFALAENNRGYTLREMKRLADALASCDRAIALKPDLAEAHNNRALVLLDLNRPEEALASYDRAVTLQPDCANTLFNRSLALLLTGQFEVGWREYEWRKSLWDRSALRLDEERLWLGGQSLEGKRIFVYHEQGLGDTIQFCRYVHLLDIVGANITLAVQKSIAPLLKHSPSRVIILGENEQPPDFDFHCPLLSLPLAFGTTLESIPSPPSYLSADEEWRAHFEALIAPGAKPRIGIVWSGSSVHKNDRNRSIAFERLSPLFSHDVQWIALQDQIRPSDALSFENCGQVAFYGKELRNFGDTAALLDLVDLVITVDTSVAHLAGAMGKPVWILLPVNPDWRWLLGRSDSPWYRSARLFRQQRYDDWEGVIEEVAAELRSFICQPDQAPIR